MVAGDDDVGRDLTLFGADLTLLRLTSPDNGLLAEAWRLTIRV